MEEMLKISPEKKYRKRRDKDQDRVIDEDFRAVIKKCSCLGERAAGHPFNSKAEDEAGEKLQKDCVSVAQPKRAFPQ